VLPPESGLRGAGPEKSLRDGHPVLPGATTVPSLRPRYRTSARPETALDFAEGIPGSEHIHTVAHLDPVTLHGLTLRRPAYHVGMPMITVRMMPGRSATQKAELVSRLTDVFLETCGNPGQHRKGVWVVIDEVPGENWAVGGELLRKPDSTTP
jgi:4-oxalocrotonate tautomerase